ncbi:GntR family transcriptional regulator [Pseudoroseomonas wenyumeiae]|uniref:GntR family transcriptional regulator n=1 Tax=Teichococcus wenyumeiae TaxID=2478470 RepID=A0A3A9JNZ7_9PROT|nr:GntR family transcriptional regulator [Pseudoroseomonas wenyumeiae]RKK05544.1 GntR family transcriptional regulator [Pseudoroseomonas wenyumeiae]RMI20726.1 GntR family transcriptional regulator [Pseudoroseomonas wenyumeiae]
MRTRAVYKQVHNAMLARLKDPMLEELRGSEAALAQEFRSSRTTIRAVLAALQQAGFLEGRHILRRPAPADFFPSGETQSAAALVELRFMNWILHSDIRPGQPVNVTQLSRQFGVSATVIRGYLQRLRHYGLLEARPNSTWIFRGITSAFATELCEIREIFELRSARHLATLEPGAPAWVELRQIRAEHLALLQDIEGRFRDFSALDERLHRLIYDASENRFVMEFYHIISIIFHYHYQWNKVDEKARNRFAILQHLDYIDALHSRDLDAVERSCRAHLNTGRETLMLSTGMRAEAARAP